MNSHAPEGLAAPAGMARSSPPSKVAYPPVGPGSGTSSNWDRLAAGTSRITVP